MAITESAARELGLAAGDQNMKESGRTEWNLEDADVASEVMGRLWSVALEVENEKL